MEIEYTNKTEVDSVEHVVVGQLLSKQPSWGIGRDKIPLEDQPRVVCEAFGRLLNILLDKKVIDLDNLNEILDSDWAFQRTATLKEKTSE